MKRSIEGYKKCEPEAMAKMSEAAIRFAFQDMKADILTLHEALKELWIQAHASDDVQMRNNPATEYALLVLTSRS